MTSTKKVTKLVLPVAGLGTRLMPLTARTPKNLVRVNGKPLIEYVLEEAALSGIREAILIVNPRHRRAFASYIKKRAEKKFPALSFAMRTQEMPGGNGHAIVQAADLIGNEPFAVRFCDDVLIGEPPVLRGLIGAFDRAQAPVILLERVPKSAVSRFGIVGIGKGSGAASRGAAATSTSCASGALRRIVKIVEKPGIKDAPSNLAIIGGYVLTAGVLRTLSAIVDTLPVIAQDALPLAVALQVELLLGKKLYGWEFPGRHFDCGTLEKLQEAEKILRKI